MVSLFILQKNCLAEPILKITKIQYKGENSNEDFIEIENTTDQEINLDNYRLAKQTSSGKKYNIKSFGEDDIIPAKEKYLWASSKIKTYPNSIDADNSTSQTISKENGIAIIFGSLDEGKIMDSENWKDDKNEKDNSEDDKKEDEKKIDYSNIKINEIYPAPNTKNKEEEFIEIKNESKEDINFNDWVVKDSKGKKGKISHTDKNGDFFVFYGKFSLNNDSKGDEVFIYDKHNNLVDSQKYTNSKSTYSYSFDGKNWRWTSSSTPNQKNAFDKILSGEINRDKKVYVDIYAYFDVKTDKDAKKFTWNFGDGHKSYLKSTRHKYEKAGKYSASLKIKGNGEDRIYYFEVKVAKYKAPKIRIIAISPNPQGSDTDNEWIEIKNESKKKINLKGWSIATGWDNLINHPIREDFEIKAGKTKKLLRDICAFTLVNTKDKLELRSPDGKAIQKIKYNHGEEPVAEDEIYKKINDDWEWVLPTSLDLENTTALLVTTKQNDLGFNISNSEIQAILGKYTLHPNWKNKREEIKKMTYLKFGINIPEKIINNTSKFLGAKKTRVENNYYVFTKPENKTHWVTSFFKSFYLKLNSLINSLI